MFNILNICLISLGIFIPLLLLKILICKKGKKRAIAELILIGIIFSMFYIFKIGETMSNKNSTKEFKSTTISKSSKKKTEDKDKTTKDDYIDTFEVPDEKKEIVSIDGVTYIDGIIIVNKTYGLPSDYKPNDTYTPVNNLNYCSTCINKEAYKKYLEMEADATSLGLHIWIQSGYRSYSFQKELYEGYIEKDGLDIANTYSAKPGHSEHQTGLAFDLNTITDEFANTDEGKWINENAYRYGFILRYPKEKEGITGYKYEPWHLRYVGEELAEKLYNNGSWITLEEHFNITSTYNE